MSLLLLLGQTAPLLGNPTGGAVVAGSATIGPAGSTLSINQSTQNAIINWQQFSIASGETTKFIVPNSGATLNRVTGGNPSAIYGNLQSNGTLYLVNPSGIVVGPSGRIDTAGFLASTLDISNQQFLAGGNLEFAGSSGASVENDGVIHASSGDVYLIANQVTNKGTLNAPQGTVGLAAGSDVLFQQAGNQHLFVQATPTSARRALGVTNSGTIRAAAAELKAAGGNAYALAINNTGVIAATGYKKINGQVYLTSDGGSISNSGRISAKQANGNGGTIVLNGTGKTKSGTVTLSGTLDASAKVAGGKGGTVTIKNMNGTTNFLGTILAKGGQGGAGGSVEVSGGTLHFAGIVNVTAPGGTTGTLLLDPATLTVVSGGIGTVSGGENDATSSSIDPTTVENALSSANLILNADTNISIDTAITWSSGNTLTLSTNTAGGSIDINAGISGVNGTLVIDTAGSNDFIGVGSAGAINVASFILQNGSWSEVSGSLPAFTASHNFELQNTSTFLRAAGGDGSAGNPYLVEDVYGLQGIGSPSGNLESANVELVNAIDASGTATWNSGAGFVPIGSSAYPYLGTFNGEVETINGLFINLPSSSNVGLFGEIETGATVEKVGVTSVNITGSSNVGGLVGYSNGGTISFSYTTGAVNGEGGYFTGGLVGENFNIINNCYSTATVTAVSSMLAVGGLTGWNSGPISNSYSTGAVTGGTELGGLVGFDDSGGGFVGATITNCYTTSKVTSLTNNGLIGGLLGFNNGTIVNSFWDTDTSTQPYGNGSDTTNTTPGITGATTAQLESQTFITANATGTPAFDFTTPVWTTNGDTTTPQLTGLPPTPPPTPPGMDVLNGTAFTDSGLTISAGTTVDLILDGAMLGSPAITGSGGTFSFTIPAVDLVSGVLLTDASVNGNTFYQANNPAADILSIDIYGNTLRVVADSASNSALSQTAGSVSGAGINYSVSGGNLSTTTGVGVSIVSNYTLDGNITASANLATGAAAVLNGSANVTLSGSSVALGGTFNRTGSLTVTSTSGDISLINVGALNIPAKAVGITLNSAGSVILNNSYLATAGGDFSATGTGSATNQNGVDIVNSVIDSQGGSISLTGQASYVFSDGQNGNVAGVGVLVDNSIVETASSTDEETTGDITINGNGSVDPVQAPVSVVNNLIGVDITHGVMSVVDGAISITGDVNSGTALAVLVDGASSLFSGSVFGVLTNNGNVITATGTGSVSIMGDSTSSTAELTNVGVDLSGIDPNTDAVANSFVSVVGGSVGLSVTGSAGTITNSPGGADISSPITAGVLVDYGTNVTAGGSAPIALNGTGGNDLNVSDDGLDSERSIGILVAGVANGGGGGSPSIAISSAGGNISLTGTAGSSIGTVEGVAVESNGGNTASISSSSGNISIMGSTPNEGELIQSLSTTNNGDTAGVNLEGGNASGAVSSVTASAGSIFIQGLVNSGIDNTREAGVIIHGGATVTASGTGGEAGATAQGDVTILGDTTSSTAQALNGGVFIYGLNTLVSASGIVPDSHEGTGLTINGTATTIDGSTQPTPVDNANLEPLTVGIGIINGATAESIGSAPTTLNGTGGTNANSFNSDNGYVDSTNGATSASYGVAVFSLQVNQYTTLSSGGNLHITGTAGASPTTGLGVVVGGPSNAGSASVVSTGGSISITGTGGAGNSGDSGAIANAGVGIFNPDNIVDNSNGSPGTGGQASVDAAGGNLTITGTAGAGALTGVDLSPYSGGGGAGEYITVLSASGNAGVTAVSGLIISDAVMNGATISFSSPIGTISPISAVQYAFAPVSLSGGAYTFTDIFNPVEFGTVNVTDLSIDESSDNAPHDTDLGSITTGNLTVTTTGNININGPINASGEVTMQNTAGDITIGANGSITDLGGGNLVLAAGTNLANSHYIINNSTSSGSPINTPDGSFYLYSADPTNDTFGGITVLPVNMIYGATFPPANLPDANAELFYVAGPGLIGPNAPAGSSAPPVISAPPSTTTGGAAGAGSTIVPPVLAQGPPPQPTPPPPPPPPGSSGDDFTGSPPPFSFTGSGLSQVLGEQDAGLASSSGNSAQVSTGDAAQLGGGQLNSVNNPQAAGALNEALGPIVYQNLSDALKDIGDWADVPDSAGGTTGDSDSGETILTGGDVAEMTSSGVTNIPLDQAPKQLQNAMNVDVLNGTGSGH